MPREAMQRKVLGKLRTIQEDEKEAVWVSGRQITELLPKENPSSVRMALLLLVDNGLVIRERKKGRGQRGKTGQSAWYRVTSNDGMVVEEIDRLGDAIEQREREMKKWKRKAKDQQKTG